MVFIKDKINPIGSAFRSVHIGLDERFVDTPNLLRYRYILFNYLRNTRNPEHPQFRKDFDNSMFSLWGQYGLLFTPLLAFGGYQFGRYLMKGIHAR